MQDMKAQIDALREAFSADKDKPFELKMSFPYGTPSDSYQPSPPLESHYPRLQMPDNESYRQQRTQPYPLQTITPPVSAISGESGLDSPLSQLNRGTGPPSNSASHSMTNYVQAQAYPQPSMPSVDEAQWNPTPIFHHWNTAFSIPQAALAPPPASAITTSPAMNFPVVQQQTHTPISPSNPNPYMTQYASSNIGTVTSTPQAQPQAQAQPHEQRSQAQQSSYQGTFVSSKEWQQSVASVYDPDGLKRRWIYAEVENQPQKRMR